MRQQQFRFLRYAYRVLFFVFLVMMVLLFFVQKDEVYNPWKDEKPKARELTDYQIREEKDSDAPAGFHRDYIIQLKKGDIVNESWLYVFTSHCYTEVYFDKDPSQVIFSLMPEEDHKNIGKTPGNRWLDMPMYEDDWKSTLIIRTYPVYQGFLQTPLIYLGTQRDVTSHIMNQSFFPFVMAVNLIFLGMIALALYRAKTGKHKPTEGLDQLGILCIVAGFWRLTDLRISPLMFRNIQPVLSYFSLSMLFLLPVPVTRYVYSRIHLKVKWPLLLTIALYVVFDCITFPLQVFGIRDLRQSLFIFQILAIGGGGLMLIMVLLSHVKMRMTRSKEPRSSVIFILSIGVFAGIVGDLISYYYGNSNMIFSSLIFLFYVVTTLIYNYRLLAQSASFDSATGISNKNACLLALGEIQAFNSFEEKEKEKENRVSLVMIDLNYLKKINDHYGHETGDRLLAAFADLLVESFEAKDFIGRFGGDEFLIIARGENSGKCENNLRELGEKASRTPLIQPDGDRITISFAAGIANSWDYPEADGLELLKKADEKMYEDKISKHAERKDQANG